MPAVALTPKAGAHGELCGLLAIRAAHEARGDARKRVLVPTSAHGTNPATAAFVGYAVEEIAQTADGRVDLADLEAKLGSDVAAIMVTNPNTCGLFERDIVEIARLTHAAGAYFYCDGANFNAIVGKVRPADLGEHAQEGSGSFGRLCAFHGQMGMYVRALTYMMSHGADGLRQVAEDAVLNANYLRVRLDQKTGGGLTQSYPGTCMHEVLFDDRFLKETGVTTLDFAKALIDEGFHPMTMYFPLVVHGALLIEPTETESKATLDQFADTVNALAARTKTD